MDYIGTNSQGTANAPNGMSDQLLGTWFQPGFPFLGAGHCAILPWHHVRNQEKRFPREHFAFAREQKRFPRERFAFARQEKRFPREHFTFARQQKRFACERFAFARQEKRFAREHFAFARQEKRFPREHFAFARQEKRFPRCRRTGVVFRRFLHPPADPAWPSARVRPPGHSKSNNFFKNFHERCIFRPLSPVLWVRGVFFQ